jgi:hypothetical protein
MNEKLERFKLQSEQQSKRIQIFAPTLDVADIVNKAIGPLLQQMENLQQQISQRSAEVLDLPMLPRRRSSL